MIRKHEVFICHSSRDAELAMAICLALENDKINCWIAPRNVTGGRSYAREIVEAINQSTVVVFVFSKDSNMSRHVESEIDKSFNANKVIIPFRIDESDVNDFLEFYLHSTHWMTCKDDQAAGIAELKRMVIANLPQRAQEENLVGALEIVKQAIKERSVSQNQISELSNTIKIMIDGKVEYADTPTREEGGYDMLVNASGDILLIINSKPGEPNAPRFVYDGGEMALLYRSRESAFSLKNITEQGREALMKESVTEIIVVEIENDDVAHEYKVPIRKVKSIKSIM